MSRGNVRHLRDARRKRATREAYRRPRHTPREASQLRRAGADYYPRPFVDHGRRRWLVGALALLCALAVFVAVLGQSPGAAKPPRPIDPDGARPGVVVAEAEGLEVSTPIRPADLTALGYHPAGESVLGLEPRGENILANPLLGMLGGASPEDIRYYVMDREQREGSGTGALDVGAEADTRVYAPVTGVVTSVRPDPTMQNAYVVQIKPDGAPDTRVSVSLLRNIDGDVGPDAPVIAGKTGLGSVANLSSVLTPQLSGYAGGSGNHVTVSVLKVG